MERPSYEIYNVGVKNTRQDQSNICNFYGRDFIITKDVLTPRPETEQFIDIVLLLAGQAYLPGMSKPQRILPERPIILDVGTGSGCIAITLALELPEATVYASDISDSALKIALKNADRLSAPIHTIISHLLKNVKSSHLPTPDLIVANLPYVDKSWPWVDQSALESDPPIALYADDGGLALIKELICDAAVLSISHLILESDPCQHQAITSFAAKHNYHLRRTMGFIQYFKHY